MLTLNNTEKDELKIYKKIYYYDLTDHIIYRFKNLKSIGTGSFSTVVKAIDYKNKSYNAIKIIHNSTLKKMDNPLNEINILKTLKHKEQNHITKLVEYFFFRKNLYMVFNLYDITLQDYIYNSNLNSNLNSNINSNLDSNYIKQIVSGIQFLNLNHIIHADIKPNNIVFKDNTYQKIMLIDFGNSITFDTITTYYNKTIQTISYRSPEICINNLCTVKQHFNYKIDIWSVGCVLYELIFKKRLFENTKNIDLFINHNIIFDPPPNNYLLTLKELHHCYDCIESPSFIKYNNIIYSFNKLKFIKKHIEHSKIIELILHCCEWNINKRFTCEQILNFKF
jgi:serine/threonine protein kinase